MDVADTPGDLTLWDGNTAIVLHWFDEVQSVSGALRLAIGVFRIVPYSAWTDGNLEETGGHLDNIVHHPNPSKTHASEHMEHLKWDLHTNMVVLNPLPLVD